MLDGRRRGSESLPFASVHCRFIPTKTAASIVLQLPRGALFLVSELSEASSGVRIPEAPEGLGSARPPITMPEPNPCAHTRVKKVYS